MFGVTGAGMSKIKNMQNDGKRARRSVDQWDRVRPSTLSACESMRMLEKYRMLTHVVQQMMDRDRRITGFLRGQSDSPIAPAGFELNNPWRVCTNDKDQNHTHFVANNRLGREADVVDSSRYRIGGRKSKNGRHYHQLYEVRQPRGVC